MHTTQQPKTFKEVINEIANRPQIARWRSQTAPGSRYHSDKRRPSRAQAKVDLRKEL